MGSSSVRKLAVLTSGGDSPAMNAAIYGFASSAMVKGYEVYGVIDGYKGLVSANFQKLNLKELKSSIHLSGTCIGSSRFLSFREPSVRKEAFDKFKDNGMDGLFVIGGDGSYMGAAALSTIGCPVIAAPGTIDNDVASSHYTIGYFSALEEIFQDIRKIKSTSESHSQITFVEVMGRHCHDLSVAASVSGAVDYVITNKSIKTKDEIVGLVKEMISAGKKGIVILVTEKVYGEENGFGLPSLKDLCVSVEKEVHRQVRFSVLGYIQRGAFPTSWDLYVAQNFGRKAFELMERKEYGLALGYDGSNFYTTPLEQAINMPKKSTTELIDFVNSSYKI